MAFWGEPGVPGERFNRLTLVVPINSHFPRRYWIAECDCGKKTRVLLHQLRSGNTKSCGCLQREKAGKTHAAVPGEKHGILTIVGPAGHWDSGLIKYEAACECGNTTYVRISDLRSGNTTSCGCRKGAGGKLLLTTHGNSDHPLYETWREARRRCTDTASANYKNYGGRGITLCERWDDFETFCADMGPRPSPQHTLERTDNDKGYSPDNCVWATKQEQSRNRRNNVRVVVWGKEYILTDALTVLGTHHATLTKRMRRDGHSIQEAIDAFILERF